ncbi:hypothetical protein CLH39_12005 [Alcaligenes faecalis]|uniref:hypothetical protein n=1 Tax=Alcaligenes faecalis TaxID=511 RepID=UPI0019344C3D|nr:hypothetical protein [Alcaligenes faecalis]QRF90912.1 hypothetical protein CLH39_12005 [Alcaligenes faecalis]
MEQQNKPMRWPSDFPGKHDKREIESCDSCGGAGDVHDFTGEWRGICHCPEGDAIRAKMEKKA